MSRELTGVLGSWRCDGKVKEILVKEEVKNGVHFPAREQNVRCGHQDVRSEDFGALVWGSLSHSRVPERGTSKQLGKFLESQEVS